MNKKDYNGDFMKYNIFSKTVKINYENGKPSDILKKEMNIYPVSNEKEDVEITIKKNDIDYSDIYLSNNPSTHIEVENGFIAKFYSATVMWRNYKEKIYVDLYLSDRKNIIKKFISIDYTYPYEGIGEIFHELVLIPTFIMFFSDTIAFVHASSVSNEMCEGFIFTGTGGVGKTSLELKLILNSNFNFLADDISPLSKDGFIYGNHSYPKIYRYNVVNEPEIRNKLLKGRSLLDLLQWRLKPHVSYVHNGKVRRRVNPKILFNNKIYQKAKISKIYFLLRGNFEKISIEQISTEKLVIASWNILMSEYNDVIFNHLRWYKINSMMNNKEALIDLDKIKSNYLKLLNELFCDKQKYIVKIPSHIKIDEKSFEIQ